MSWTKTHSQYIHLVQVAADGPIDPPETNKTNGEINCVNTYNNMYEVTY